MSWGISAGGATRIVLLPSDSPFRVAAVNLVIVGFGTRATGGAGTIGSVEEAGLTVRVFVLVLVRLLGVFSALALLLGMATVVLVRDNCGLMSCEQGIGV